MADLISKRKADEIEVPKPGEDPAERKRLLNVLAQRRYRQRKKDHLRKLERQAKEHQESHYTSVEQGAEVISPTSDNPTIATPPQFNMNLDTLDPHSLNKPLVEPDLDANFFPTEGLPSNDSDPTYFMCNPFDAWDTSTLFPTQTIPSSPSDPYISSSSQSPDSATSQQSQITRQSEDSLFDFQDQRQLPMLELKLLRGAITIAKRLNVESILWSLDSTSPFNQASSLTMSFDHLPANLRPTTVQMVHPHHPVLDIMPWPSVRDRMILIFNQPEEFRPPIAASPTALIDFIYDIEDTAEGVRICGEDPCSDENWEVGQRVFSRWWWAFESKIIKQSNAMRSQRGANVLTMQSHGPLSPGSVLGEVD